MKKLMIAAAAALAMTVSNVQAAEQTITPDDLERNKANVLAFYELAFNQHKLQEAVDQYIGEEYLQHNPDVADGGQAFIEAFQPYLKSFPQARASVKRVAADGDLVWLHVHSQSDGNDRGQAVVDILRLNDEGKIVEHWDVIQNIPEKTASGRDMF